MRSYVKPKGNTLHYLGFKDLNFSQVIENLNNLQQNHCFYGFLTCNNCLLLARPKRTLEIKDLNGIETNLLTTIITIMVLWLILLFSTVSSFLREPSSSSSFVPCLRIFWLGWHRLREFFYVSDF